MNIKNLLIKCLFEYTEYFDMTLPSEYFQVMDEVCEILLKDHVQSLIDDIDWFKKNKCVSDETVYYVGPEGIRFDMIESDSILNFIRGKFTVGCGLQINTFSAPGNIWETTIEFKNWEVIDVTAFNHHDDSEVVFISNGKKVKKLERESFPDPSDRNAMATRYKYEYY